MVLTGAAAIWVARALGFPLVQQVFFGAIVALSSTAVTLKLLLDRGEMDTPHGAVTVGISLLQDLSLVAMIVMLPAWAAAAVIQRRRSEFRPGESISDPTLPEAS